MRRAWAALALAGLGVARGDGPDWRPAAPPPVRLEPAPAPPPPVTVPPIPMPPSLPAGPTWATAAPRPAGPMWASAQPPADPPPRPPTKPLPVPPKLFPPPEPKPEPAPPPKPVPPQPKPVEPPPRPLPQPRPDEPPKAAEPPTRPADPPGVAFPPPPTEVLLEPPPGGVVRAGLALPVRHGVVGSPELSFSRDGTGADLFAGGPLPLDAAAVAARSFVSAEYLLWWVRPAGVPVLATTATGQAFGYLGDPGTEPLLGPGNFGSTSRQGFRARAGTWADDGTGLDGSFFFLGEQTTRFDLDSARFPTIARPIFAANLNREFGELVAFPGLADGRLTAETTSLLWGADVNVRACLTRQCDRRAEAFAGYRHLTLRESLTVTEFLTARGPLAPDPAGTRIVVSDAFRTRNQFHGGQVGWAGSYRTGRLEVGGRGSVGFGVTSQQLTVTGSQARTRPGGGAERFAGGLLAAGPNLGEFGRSRFSVVPEATLDVGLWLTPGVRLAVGYDFLLWTNVLRPGDQIDRVVDLSFVPNAPALGFVANRPLPTFRQADVWAQGLQLGVEIRW